MASYTASDVLNLWEQSWGALPETWRIEFLNHPALPKILLYPDKWIRLVIPKKRKLATALTYLENLEKKREPREYWPQTPESDEMIDNLTKTIRNGSGSTIPPDDWWRDQV